MVEFGQERQMKTCKVEGCKERVVSKEYCQRHYMQVRVHGKVDRTRFDKNEYWFEDEVCCIQLYSGENTPKCIAIIDKEDYEKVKGYKWNFRDSNGRVVSNIGYLSRFVMNMANSKLDVDHKDHDQLNNKKDNLRICTRSQNNANRSVSSRNTSGKKGVHLDQRRQKWQAKITVNGKIISLGQFYDLEEAAKAYNKAALKYYGEFALLNEVKLEGEQNGP